ncbi:MAG: hypothetical protein ACRDOO_26640 [Actinomadura sp.]
MADERERLGPRMTREDFDRALEHAERLLATTDRTRTWLTTVRLAAGGIVAVLAAALDPTDGSAGRLVLLVVLAAVIAAGLIAVEIWVRARLRRDEIPMVDMVDMARELLPILADEENWSHADVRLAQARISRFPIAASGGSQGP